MSGQMVEALNTVVYGGEPGGGVWAHCPVGSSVLVARCHLAVLVVVGVLAVAAYVGIPCR